MPIQRPTWLPAYIPELDGLRGVAVLAVVFYHCNPRLQGTWIYGATLWGWAGVNLFFVLSGFLITSILLGSRETHHYFRNFYGRRILRIWPVYVLLLVAVYLEAPWYVGLPVGRAIMTAPWWAYILFLQNLFHLSLAGTFLLIGAWQIVSYSRRPKSLGAGHRSLPFGIPYGFVIVVGLIEIVAALGLVIPVGSIPPERLALVAATGLAVITLTVAIYRTRRQQSAVPSTTLFLMALFVILGHTV